MSLYDLGNKYQVNAAEVEEQIRDTALWLLRGWEKILEPTNFYYHLRKECEATPEEIKMAEKAMRQMSQTIFGLMANLKYRSSIGEIVRGIRSYYPGRYRYLGERTLKRLEDASIGTIGALSKKTLTDLTQLGIRIEAAELILGYVQARVR